MSEDLKNVLTKSDDTTETNSIPQKKEYVPSSNMTDILNMMDMESKSIVNKSWSKINRSNKITLLENFIESEIEDKNLDEKTGNNLKKLLIQSFNSNLLNKQSDIVYDSLQNTIIEIKSLKYDSDTNTYQFTKCDSAMTGSSGASVVLEIYKYSPCGLESNFGTATRVAYATHELEDNTATKCVDWTLESSESRTLASRDILVLALSVSESLEDLDCRGLFSFEITRT